MTNIDYFNDFINKNINQSKLNLTNLGAVVVYDFENSKYNFQCQIKNNKIIRIYFESYINDLCVLITSDGLVVVRDAFDILYKKPFTLSTESIANFIKNNSEEECFQYSTLINDNELLALHMIKFISSTFHFKYTYTE